MPFEPTPAEKPRRWRTLREILIGIAIGAAVAGTLVWLVPAILD